MLAFFKEAFACSKSREISLLSEKAISWMGDLNISLVILVDWVVFMTVLFDEVFGKDVFLVASSGMF